jgi:hypothetical protein
MLQEINMDREGDGTWVTTRRPLAWERQGSYCLLGEIPEARCHAEQACGRARVFRVLDLRDRERGRGGEGRRLRRG